MSNLELSVLKNFIKDFYKAIVFYVFSRGVSKYISIFTISIIGASTDAILSGDFSYLKNNTLIIFMVLFISTFIIPFITLISCRLYVNVGKEFDKISYSKFLRQKSRLLNKYELGEFLYRIPDDTIGYRGGLLTLIGDGVIVIYVIVQSFYVLYKINISMAIIALVLTSIPILIIKFLDKKLKGYYKKEKEARGEIYNKEKSIIESFQFIKSHNINDKIINSLRKDYNKYLTIFKKLSKTTNLFELFKEIFSIASEILIYIVGSYFISISAITIGSAIEFFAISIILKDNTLLFTRVINNFYSFKVASKRYLEWTTDFEESGNIKTNSLYPIKIDGLKYSYDKNIYALDEVSFSINEGDHIILEGSNGSGKSTIINILTGLYNDYEGTITVNNIDHKKLDLTSLRDKIAYLNQNPFFVNDTVYNNVKLFTNSSEKDILSIFEKLGILYLKDKIIGGNGDLLSGGERQKVALSRILLSEKKLIILDEPDTALDIDSRHQIIEYLSKSDKTFLVITHNKEWKQS